MRGDFDDIASLDAALAGVQRAMLVCGAGQHEQYDREVAFLAAAARAQVEAVVRVSTASCLISTGSTGVYARAHGCLETYISETKAKVCKNYNGQRWGGELS